MWWCSSTQLLKQPSAPPPASATLPIFLFALAVSLLRLLHFSPSSSASVRSLPSPWLRPLPCIRPGPLPVRGPAPPLSPAPPCCLAPPPCPRLMTTASSGSFAPTFPALHLPLLLSILHTSSWLAPPPFATPIPRPRVGAYKRLLSKLKFDRRPGCGCAHPRVLCGACVRPALAHCQPRRSAARCCRPPD